jgi:hypothetical protein
MMHVTGRLLTTTVAGARYEAVKVGDTIACAWWRKRMLLDAPVYGRDVFTEQFGEVNPSVA